MIELENDKICTYVEIFSAPGVVTTGGPTATVSVDFSTPIQQKYKGKIKKQRTESTELKEKRSGLSKEQEQEICKLYQSGMSSPDVGDKVGVTAGSVRKVLARNGVEIRPRGTRSLAENNEDESSDSAEKAIDQMRAKPITSAKLMQIKSMVEDDVSSEQIAIEVGMSVERIEKIRAQLNL